MSVNNRLRPAAARSTPSSPRKRPGAIISLISVTRAYPRTHEHENFCIRAVLPPPALFTLAINPTPVNSASSSAFPSPRRASPCLRFLRSFGGLPVSHLVPGSFPHLLSPRSFSPIDTVAPVDRVDRHRRGYYT